MESSTKTALVIALVVVVLLLLLLLMFGGSITSGTIMNGGMMGSGHMDGFGWMWLPILLVVGLGAVLLAVLFGRK